MEKCPTKCGNATKGKAYKKTECLPCWCLLNAPQVFGDAPKRRLQLNCFYLGDKTRKMHSDGTTSHMNECGCQWGRNCNFHKDECTQTPWAPGIRDCNSCDDYSKTAPKESPFKRVVFINLERRKDRLTAFRERQQVSGWELPEPIIFPAVDGRNERVPTYYKAGGGAWGCLRSHVTLLEKAYADGVENVLVLEDDATWMKGVTSEDDSSWKRLSKFMNEVPSDWEMLMLGGQHQGTPEKVKDGVVKCLNCQRTHAYAIRRSLIPELLDLWKRCDTHIDHWLGPWQADRKVYAPHRFIFGQMGGVSDISGTVSPAKYWIPPNGQPVIHLTAPPEVVKELRKKGFHTGYSRDKTSDIDRGLLGIETINPESRYRKIKSWCDAVLWEVASMEGIVATLWHPNITVDELKDVYMSGPVVPVAGTTVEECVSAVPPDIKVEPSLGYYERLYE